MTRTIASLLFAAAAIVAAGARAGDAGKGKAVFQRCAVCHNVQKGGGNGLGPNLFGVINRKAGTASGYPYSQAMRSAGFLWTPTKLAQYVTHPSQVVPGNKMAFAGINDAGQTGDLIAYLQTLK